MLYPLKSKFSLFTSHIYKKRDQMKQIFRGSKTFTSFLFNTCIQTYMYIHVFVFDTVCYQKQSLLFWCIFNNICLRVPIS